MYLLIVNLLDKKVSILEFEFDYIHICALIMIKYSWQFFSQSPAKVLIEFAYVFQAELTPV